MRLDKKRYEPTPLKENLLIYYEDITKVIQPISQLIEKSFYIAFWETKVYIMTLNPNIVYCTGGKHKARRPNPALHLVLSSPAPCFYPAAAPSSLLLVKE